MNGLCMDDVLSVMDEIHMVFRLNNNNWLDVNDMLSLVNWLKVDVRLFTFPMNQPKQYAATMDMEAMII